MSKRYVIFREDPNTHHEIYIVRPNENDTWQTTESPDEAMPFNTARDAYQWAKLFTPVLDWWHVGAR